MQGCNSLSQGRGNVLQGYSTISHRRGNVLQGYNTISHRRGNVLQESYTYFIQGGVIETVGDGDADARVSFTDCLYDGQNTDNGKTGFYGARGFVGTNSGHADFTRCLLDPAGAVTTLTYLGANFCPGGDNVSITDCYYTQPYGPAQGTDATGMSAADLAAALGSAWTVSEGHARPRLMRNALDETNTVFGAVQIVGGTPTGVTTSDGVCTFLGTYDPVVIGASGDRHKLYLGAANTLYYPNAAMTIGAFRAYFQLNGATASPDPSQGGGMRCARSA